jgi:SPP1 family predicted phage head-tail adaptor
MLTRLPHRVTLQTETRTLFQGGAYTSSFTTSSVEWANVQVDVSNESYDQAKKQQLTKYKVVMRYSSNITNAKRLLFGGKVLVIESVEDGTGRSRMIILKCRQENT